MLNGTKTLDLQVKEGGITTQEIKKPGKEGGGGGAGCCIGCIGTISCTNDGTK
ncbi:hypothetical protein NSQ59_15880 [Margalitia sp. FSL K6-0131]|uniref:hypothetical protein n=1 Tax=Margalitia sp. FSL K6-0131 TaxID=2954604 RepID=UPI0030F54844